MRKQIHYFILTIMVFCASVMLAQPVIIKAKMDSTQLWIGNQTGFTFEILQAPGQKVTAPIFSDTLVGNLDIVEQAKMDTVKLSNDKIQVNIRYKLTSFQDSLVYVPAFPFVTGKDTAWSNSTSLKVVQPFVIDTAANSLTDIKPVYKPPFDWKNFLQKLLLAILLLALTVILFILVRKFVMKKPVFHTQTPAEIIPPNVEALRRLDKIKDEKIWQKGRVKEYHTELTDVLRIYIERVFNIPSMEMTSDEILLGSQFLKVDKPAAFEGLKQILRLADLVKFAKWNPETVENELSLMNAYLFVNQTTVDEIKSEESKPDKTAEPETR